MTSKSAQWDTFHQLQIALWVYSHLLVPGLFIQEVFFKKVFVIHNLLTWLDRLQSIHCLYAPVLIHSGPVYTIPDLRFGSFFISDWGCVYTDLHESDTLCSNNPVHLCSASPGDGDAKMDPVQSVPFCLIV